MASFNHTLLAHPMLILNIGCTFYSEKIHLHLKAKLQKQKNLTSPCEHVEEKLNIL